MSDTHVFLPLSTYSLQILQGVQFGTEATVDAKELLIHNRCQGQGAEGFHTGFVDSLRIFVLAFEFEGKVVRQMSALVVTSQQPESMWIPYLQRPQVQHTLDSVNQDHGIRRQNSYLDTEVPSIHIVSQEKIPRLRRITTNFE